jgi:hypothetical protein
MGDEFNSTEASNVKVKLGVASYGKVYSPR